MLNGLLTYPGNPIYNIGDYVQSIAARQYFDKIDIVLNREELKDYNGEKVRMIMNAWYMHNPNQWPPSSMIDPLFVSFHMNEHVKDEMLSPKGIAYLKRHEPIGCRDTHTVELLISKGVDAYYSCCLTTTLDIQYKSDRKTDNIYFVDPAFQISFKDKYLLTPRRFAKGVLKGEWYKLAGKRRKALNLFLSKSLQEKAVNIPHMYRAPETEQERFDLADSLLKKYAEAKLVVTSRIHCALPCLAVGTPVIFVNYGFDSKGDQCRFEGIADLFNTVNIDKDGNMSTNFDFTGLIDENFSTPNPNRHLKYAKALKEKCYVFTKN